MSFGTVSGAIGMYAAGLATWQLVGDRKEWDVQLHIKELKATMKQIEDMRSTIKPAECELIMRFRPEFFAHWDEFAKDMSEALDIWDEAASGASWLQRNRPAFANTLKQKVYKAKRSVGAFRADILKTTNTVRRRLGSTAAENVPSWNSSATRDNLSGLIDRVMSLLPLPPIDAGDTLESPEQMFSDVNNHSNDASTMV
ncbi:uncharacterized protein LAESUDRAFT_808586 [Laetiporus sulphureus 93-53]|uniref:Uncharacterized protein n=1 Tax=Laetiporus sulphureus 93-53 TaxID=1314785 RepID=A0A165IIH9_9APHY|nr:uncharacterized protein LAESUDRAFT_808586 [Laetiporus sulphureus 93-53]KZT13121.1 hypothetical protein LAESUDRAFT_808586 [Laetiporus sulphureus 93-53]